MDLVIITIATLIISNAISIRLYSELKKYYDRLTDNFFDLHQKNKKLIEDYELAIEKNENLFKDVLFDNNNQIRKHKIRIQEQADKIVELENQLKQKL